MKITRQLQITQNEFYDYLEKELLDDIQQCTKKNYTQKDIKKGMKYSKYIQDAHARVDITIQKYKRGEIYETKIKTFSDSIIISYHTSQNENGLTIVFQEHIHSFESQKRNLINKTFHEIVYLRRMNETLYDIETQIIKQRQGIQNKKTHALPEHKLLYQLFFKNKI